MGKYPEYILARIGPGLVVRGWGLPFAIIVPAAIGLWPDPDPNPIGPGLLFFSTCWPAIVLLAIGIHQIRRAQPSACAP